MLGLFLGWLLNWLLGWLLDGLLDGLLDVGSRLGLGFLGRLGLNGLGFGLCRFELNATHIGEFTHLAFQFIGDDIGRILLTQSTGNEHQSFNLIYMRQHFLYRHVHNLLFLCCLAITRQGFALHSTCKFRHFF